MYELIVESQFDSAHNLRNYEGPCEGIHGHTYRVQIHYQSDKLDDIGMVADFKLLKAALNEVVTYMDHKYLNDLPEFSQQNPTAERIARVVYEKLKTALMSGIKKATVWETPGCSASYWEDE